MFFIRILVPEVTYIPPKRVPVGPGIKPASAVIARRMTEKYSDLDFSVRMDEDFSHQYQKSRSYQKQFVPHYQKIF